MPRLRPALALLTLALVAPLAACEDGRDPKADGHTEGVYVTTGGLSYQVQISRKLNPYDVEDAEYLKGIPDAKEQVANTDYAWFGVFVRVENRTDNERYASEPEPLKSVPTANFELTDINGDHAEPTTLPADNVFAYRPGKIQPGGQLPLKSSIAAQGPIGGALVLFRAKQSILENRPTQLHIEPLDGSEPAHVNLDI